MNDRRFDTAEITEAIEACGFQLLETCKIGGQGIVLKMENTSLERVVAVKIPLDFGEDNRSFLTEAKTLAKLSHPNIVNVYSCGLAYSEHSAASFPYIEMEYIEGLSLREILDNSETISESEAIKIIVGICRGLHAAHQNEIDHGDIKPENILFRDTDVDEDKTAKRFPLIVDFGIARSPSHRADSPAAGTPDYVAPEQRVGKPANRASDIYSVGKLLHELLTGIPGDGSEQVEKLSPVLRQIIQKCCEFSPAKRFATANQLANDLERYSNDFPTETGETSLLHRGILNWKRRKRVYIGLIAGLLVLAASFLWNARTRSLEAASFQKELEGYVEEATEIENQLRGRANIQDAQLTLIERLESRLSKSSRKWKDNQFLVAKHSRLLNHCAKIHRIVGNHATALERNASAKNVLQKYDEGASTEIVRAIGISHQFHGLLMEDDGNSEASLRDFQEMERLFQVALSRPDSKWSDWANASSAAVNQAVVLEQQGNLQKALAAYVRSRELLVAKQQENDEFDEDLAFILNNEAPIYVLMGQHKKAIELIRQSAVVRRRLYEEDPTNQMRKFELAQASMNSGIIIIDATHARPDHQIDEDPEKYFDEAIELFEDLVEDNPKVVSYKSDLLKTRCCKTTARYRKYALEHGKDGDRLDVEEDVAEIVELSQEFELDGESTIGVAIFYLSAGRVSRDKDLIEAAVGQFEMMANHYPEMAELQSHLAWAYNEADRFYQAEAAAEKLYVSERATEKYAAAFNLEPNRFKFYRDYREAIEDQIRKCNDLNKDASAWTAKLEKLNRFKPAVVSINPE